MAVTSPLILPPYRIPFDGVPNEIIVVDEANFYDVPKVMTQISPHSLPLGRDYNIFPVPVVSYHFDYFLGDDFYGYPYLWNYATWIYVATYGHMNVTQDFSAGFATVLDYYRGLYAREPNPNYGRKNTLIRQPRSIIVNDFTFAQIYDTAYLDDYRLFIGTLPFYDLLSQSYPGNVPQYPAPLPILLPNAVTFTTDIFNKIYIGECIYLIVLGNQHYDVMFYPGFMSRAIENFKVFLSKHKRYKIVIFFQPIPVGSNEDTVARIENFRSIMSSAYPNTTVYMDHATIDMGIATTEIEEFYGD